MTEVLLQSLRDAKLKATPARRLILDIFSAGCQPINAEFIYHKLKTKKINQVTVYRTLSSLEQAGMIKRVNLRKDSAYYELAANHHHHVVCKGCGKIESFDTCTLTELSKNILKHSSQFKVIVDHSLELFGYCRHCRPARAARATTA